MPGEQLKDLFHMAGVIGKHLLLSCALRANDYVVDVHISKWKVFQDPFHHALELGVDVADTQSALPCIRTVLCLGLPWL